MARDIRIFDVTIPVGGTPTAPQSFNMTMPARIVTAVEIVIPDGNRGNLHFGLGAGGTMVIPSNAGGFITGNDEVIHWPLAGFIDSGAWQLFAYNVGTLSHLVQVRFLCELPWERGQVPVTLLPIGSIGDGGVTVPPVTIVGGGGGTGGGGGGAGGGGGGGAGGGGGGGGGVPPVVKPPTHWEADNGPRHIVAFWNTKWPGVGLHVSVTGFAPNTPLRFNLGGYDMLPVTTDGSGAATTIISPPRYLLSGTWNLDVDDRQGAFIRVVVTLPHV